MIHPPLPLRKKIRLGHGLIVSLVLLIENADADFP